MRTKLQKEAAEKTLRWMVEGIEFDLRLSTTKKQEDQAKERMYGLNLICREAKIDELFDKIKKELKS